MRCTMPVAAQTIEHLFGVAGVDAALQGLAPDVLARHFGRAMLPQPANDLPHSTASRRLGIIRWNKARACGWKYPDHSCAAPSIRSTPIWLGGPDDPVSDQDSTSSTAASRATVPGPFPQPGCLHAIGLAPFGMQACQEGIEGFLAALIDDQFQGIGRYPGPAHDAPKCGLARLPPRASLQPPSGLAASTTARRKEAASQFLACQHLVQTVRWKAPAANSRQTARCGAHRAPAGPPPRPAASGAREASERPANHSVDLSRHQDDAARVGRDGVGNGAQRRLTDDRGQLAVTRLGVERREQLAHRRDRRRLAAGRRADHGLPSDQRLRQRGPMRTPTPAPQRPLTAANSDCAT